VSTIVNAAPSFLTLPSRTSKPRRTGITHVLDNGLPVSTVRALLGVCADHVDVWKLGWGTSYLDPGLSDKIALLAQHGVLTCAGGTLLEVAWQQGAVPQFLDWAAQVGFPCVEVSRGVADMPLEAKQASSRRRRSGSASSPRSASRTPDATVDAGAWAAEAAATARPARAGSSPRAGRAGRSGCSTPTAAVRGDVVDAVVTAVGIDCTVFEAPRKEQQAWLVRRFGADVNLANVAPGDVLGVEALRLGLRADTFDRSRHPS
jgi:phosphosulfolactate synthase